MAVDEVGESMRILICGGRTYTDEKNFNALMDFMHWRRWAHFPPTIIIHGGARGADTLADKWAKKHGHSVLPFLADWNDLTHPKAVIRTRPDGSKYDLLAGYRRNQRMIDEGKPEVAVAFPGGGGTTDMVTRARKAGIEVTRVK